MQKLFLAALVVMASYSYCGTKSYSTEKFAEEAVTNGLLSAYQVYSEFSERVEFGSLFLLMHSSFKKTTENGYVRYFLNSSFHVLSMKYPDLGRFHASITFLTKEKAIASLQELGSKEEHEFVTCPMLGTIVHVDKYVFGEIIVYLMTLDDDGLLIVTSNVEDIQFLFNDFKWVCN